MRPGLLRRLLLRPVDEVARGEDVCAAGELERWLDAEEAAWGEEGWRGKGKERGRENRGKGELVRSLVNERE